MEVRVKMMVLIQLRTWVKLLLKLETGTLVSINLLFYNVILHWVPVT